MKQKWSAVLWAAVMCIPLLSACSSNGNSTGNSVAESPQEPFDAEPASEVVDEADMEPETATTDTEQPGDTPIVI